MNILGIETSCDETAVAIVNDGSRVLSNALASSLPIHTKTGGIIPETAAREQSKTIIPVIDEVLSPLKKGGQKNYHNDLDIDAISVVYGPGLVGSLLVGVEAARTLSFVWKKPLIPVNHLIGHFYSAWLNNPRPPQFPCLALIVSGGHTELLFVSDHGKWRHLGGTRDDAAGEAFDKIARLLDLGYPGGPAIQRAAIYGNPRKFQLPRPLISSNDHDFSFSGLKTASRNLIAKLSYSNNKPDTQKTNDLAASIQAAIVDVLVVKTLKAARAFGVRNIILGGGVAANESLREKMTSGFDGNVVYSKPEYSVDNAAMVASAAYFNYKPVSWQKVKVDPSLLF
jgi:N6-L-threonylcarbamoyladenine synthase